MAAAGAEMKQLLKGDEYATLYRPSHFPPDEVQEGRMTCGTGNMWLQFTGRPQWYRVGRHLSEWKAKIWLDACVTVDDVVEALELEVWPPLRQSEREALGVLIEGLDAKVDAGEAILLVSAAQYRVLRRFYTEAHGPGVEPTTYRDVPVRTK